MASITIPIVGPLPNLCVCCGQPAEVVETREFHWEQPKEELSTGEQVRMGVGFLLDVASGSGGFSRRAQEVRSASLILPFCKRGAHRWRLLGPGMIAALLGILAGVVLLALGNSSEDAAQQGGWANAVGLVLFLLGVGWGLLRFFTGPKLSVTSGNDQEVVLTGIAPRFAKALQQQSLSPSNQATDGTGGHGQRIEGSPHP